MLIGLFRILKLVRFVWWLKTERRGELKQQIVDLRQLQQELAVRRSELEDLQHGMKAIEQEYVKSGTPAGDAQTVDARLFSMNLAIDRLVAKYPGNVVAQKASEKAKRFYGKQIREQARFSSLP